jgi:hypothetical protein
MIRSLSRSILLLAALVLATPVAAECLYPTPPSVIPAGDSATYEEMLRARDLVHEFDEDIRTYTVCLQLDVRSILEDPSVSDARKEQLLVTIAELNDAAVDHAEYIVASFNEQLRIFRERNAN